MNRRLIAAIFCLSLVSAQGLAQDEDVLGEEEQASALDENEVPPSEPKAAPPPSEPPASQRPGAIRDTSTHERPMAASVLLHAPWYYGFGIGMNARFEIPIVADGFISAINDQVSLEPSLGVGYRRWGYGVFGDKLTFLDITPALYGMWSFHITPKFRPYAALGLGYDIAIWLNEDEFLATDDPRTSYFYWDLAVGLFYKFSENFAFRGELGSQGPKAGLSLFF